MPIFNDESIYLDWAWRQTNQPGYLFYSLYDGKQPFLIWIFGISEHIFTDPLFAGRMVSVICGFLSLIGIYVLTKKYFSALISILASLLYIFTPIFSFFDRQALMESAITAVGIWSIYYYLNSIKSNKKKDRLLLGIILGIGFFIKSSSFVYIFTLIILESFFRKTPISFRIKSTLFTIFVSFITSSILLIQPEFWKTLSMNSRYSLTLSEFFKFPITHFNTNLFSSLEIGLVYLTPFVFVLGVFGFFYMRKESEEKKIIVYWTIISTLLFLIFARTVIPRYIVTFFPLFIISSAYFLTILRKKTRISILMLAVLLYIIPLFITVYSIFYPIRSLLLISKVSRFPQHEYVYGYTSGIGIAETKKIIDSLSKNQKIAITIPENAGNPESAMQVYFSNNRNVEVIYLPNNLIPTDSKYECIDMGIPAYYVTRTNYLIGYERFMKPYKFIKNPFSNYYIGIYSIPNSCKNKLLLHLEKVK